MKIVISGLGEVPTTVKLVLDEEKPDVTYLICSDYQLEHVATYAGYEQPNETMVRAAAKRVGTKLVIKKCDVFDLEATCDAVGEILQQISMDDEIVINYAGGSAGVKLILGMTGVVLSKFMRAKIVYAIEYPGGLRIVEDQTKVLGNIFKRLYELV